MSGEERTRLRALDHCLELVEDAIARGQERVDATLAMRLRLLLGLAGLIPDHRLEGRRVDRVLDDIFALQAGVLGHEVEAAG
ncbi:MAG: hypothetical protein J2P45_12425 [Candidatus Dormibacteraeota bacterium]|nr:hypothetical protein [Candidatus Dormibacteraeota bacterium]